jgi:hypothetical protein
MASFDDDVVIIGSGFGGSVAALRAAEMQARNGHSYPPTAGPGRTPTSSPATAWPTPLLIIAGEQDHTVPLLGCRSGHSVAAAWVESDRGGPHAER